MAAALDTGLTSVTKILWSENGSSETANLAATAATLKAATNADPSVKATDGALESATASGACTITHFAFADVSDVLQTTWNALDTSRTLAIGDKLTIADGALSERLDATTSAPA
jgi:hypothetical protein